jgi:branched-chain amino acid aminotransferase
MPARTVWCDGAQVPWDSAKASVLGHAMQRGSLVFDVAALREAPDGSVFLFRPREHVARFLRSVALVGLVVPWSEADLLEATLETARASGKASALVRWSALLPGLEGDVVPRDPSRTSTVIAVITPEDALAPDQTPAPKPAVARVALSREIRKAGPEVLPPQAKVGAAYLGPMLAKKRAIEAGCDEVVLLDREGMVAEAPTANVFAVRAGTLLTPPTERVLAGITRASVIELANAEGLRVQERHLTPEELTGADEAFLAGTSLPIQPIVAVDGAALRGGAPGPITARVRERVLACERGVDPRFREWAVRVR